MQLFNFIVPKISSSLDQGHIQAELLLEKIKSHDGSEAYHSLFDMEERPNFKGYQGIARPASGFFAFDFDSLDLELVRQEVLRLVEGLKLQQAWFFFSGSKGFHVYVAASFFGVPVDVNTVSKYADIVSDIKKRFKLTTLDDGIVQANRKFRLPGSKHPKTGLYKTQIGFTELKEFTIEQIKEKASTRQPIYYTLVDEEHTYSGTQDFRGSSYSFAQSEIMPPQDASMLKGLGAFGHDNVIEEDISNGSLFKEFPRKVCVARMWASEHQEGERHAIASILISDLFHIGVDQATCESRISEWASKQGISAERIEADLMRMTREQYSGRRDYSYGCYHNIKKKFCSGTCELYPKLSKEKRAEVLDIPAKVQKQLEESDKPSERKLVQEVINSFEGKIIKQDKDLFIYKDTHWVEASQREIDWVKEMLFQKLGKRAKSKDMKSAFETFVHGVPAVPPHINMFEPNPNAANFLNGTLWVERVKGEYTLKFKSHSQDDFLTSCLAVNYTPHNDAKNLRFSEFLEHLLEGDPEREEKIRALKQVAGAMMMPRFPQIFFFLGESGTGKSTFVKLFFRLIGGSRVSGFVQPCDMHGFHLEGLIHKTVNIHTDVNEHRPIPDEFFKSSGDRIPMQINRKGRKVVQSFLPAIHVFCANTLPPTKVKNQNVYDRRMTIIKLDKIVERKIDQFEDLVFEESTEALVQFALEGVRDIIGAGGFYTKPGSSKSLTKAWQAMGSDPIQDFLDDVKHNEVSGLKIEPHGSLKRAALFDKFSQWSIDFGLKQAAVTRGSFYRELETRGFRLKMVKGERQVEGFSSEGAGSSSAPVQTNF